MKSTLIRLGLLAVMISALAGCGGSDGAPGAAGVNGTNGGSLVAASNLTAAEWAALTPTIDPASISITIASPPVVKFKVTDANGNPLVGLGTKGTTNLNNIWFTLAKLVPVTGGPSKWVTYLVTSSSDGGVTWTGNFPQRDREGTMVDNGDGTYEYTFFRDITKTKAIVDALPDNAAAYKYTADLGDTTYVPSLTHRLGIVISGNQPGSSPAVSIATPTNVTMDFRPDGGTVASTRNIVQRSSCDECHSGKVIGHGDRRDPNLCVTCHTEQIKYSFDNLAVNSGEALSTNGGLTLTGGQTASDPNTKKRMETAIVDGRALGNYPNMIHKMHMGEELVKTGYFFNADAAGLFNEKKLPQSPSNCIKCHDGSSTAVNQTVDGDNWKMVPSRLACGACHDGINFADSTGVTLANRDADVTAGNPVGTTATGHDGGAVAPQSNDSLCSGCHTPLEIPIAHRYTVATPHNPVQKAGVSSFSYDLKSVTLNASRNPVFTFKITKDGAAVTTLGTPTAQIPGFTGGPSLYVAFAVPQDGIAAPADFNAYASSSLQNILDGTKGTLASTTADASDYFTATVTGTVASPITVPANAKIVTGAVIGHYTQQGLVDYPAGLSIKTRLALKTATGYTARRAIVQVAKCDSCHDQLGTSPEFHGGDRNDPQACNICHNGNTTSSGWSADTSTYIHGIHGASKRSVPFTWHAVSATEDYSMIGYPGLLKNCNQCHLPDTVNFGATGGATVAPNLLWSTTAYGIFNSTVGATTNGCTVSAFNTCIASDASVHALSPYVIKDNTYDYGARFSYSVASGTGIGTAAASSTLVNSPIASACFACHDTALAKLHIEGNGGAIYQTRLSQSDLAGNLVNKEQCLVCHGKGRVADVAVVHQQ